MEFYCPTCKRLTEHETAAVGDGDFPICVEEHPAQVLNYPLGRKVIEFVEAHPGQHDQGTWLYQGENQPTFDCGTTGCLAGWTVMLSESVTLDPGVNGRAFVKDENGDEQPILIPAYAREVLGLTLNQANELFFQVPEDIDPIDSEGRERTDEELAVAYAKQIFEVR